MVVFLKIMKKSGKRDSDPRPQPWQGCALPTELLPQDIILDIPQYFNCVSLRI